MSIDRQDSIHGSASRTAIVIGGGPAGLMAAEVLAGHGIAVALYDAMPSVGRKFLLAGKGGLNLTHAESPGAFNGRYGERAGRMTPLLARLDAAALRAWALQLGVDTFVGSSQRVFPVGMKAAPLLRACLHRLRAQGVQFHMRHRWLGWVQPDGASVPAATAPGQHLIFATPDGTVAAHADAVVLALAAAAGRDSARMAHGCRCCARAASRWRHCCLPTAASTLPGVRISPNAMPGNR